MGNFFDPYDTFGKRWEIRVSDNSSPSHLCILKYKPYIVELIIWKLGFSATQFTWTAHWNGFNPSNSHKIFQAELCVCGWLDCHVAQETKALFLIWFWITALLMKCQEFTGPRCLRMQHAVGVDPPPWLHLAKRTTPPASNCCNLERRRRARLTSTTIGH